MAYAMVVFSWGFNTPTAIANGLRFKVQGFKFNGLLQFADAHAYYSLAVYHLSLYLQGSNKRVQD